DRGASGRLVHCLVELLPGGGDAADGEGGEDIAAGDRGGAFVVPGHEADGGGKLPHPHRPRDHLRGVPAGTAVDGGDVALKQPARADRAGGARVEVVEQRQPGMMPRGHRVDAEPAAEVVDAAGDRVDGNPGHGCPVRAVGRGGQHHVVAGAAGPEPAVGPADVEPAGAVDGHRGKNGPRRLPPKVCWKMLATLITGPQVAPPFTERNATSPLGAKIGTTTSPPGCTTGAPPVACSRV